MIWLAQYTTFCTAKFATFFFQIIFYLVDSNFKLTTRNSAMIGFLALFALFGSNWGIELSVGKDAEVNLFEADCTIIDTVKKLSSRLWLSSESLNDDQLEVALAKARKKNKKLKSAKRARERKRLVNDSHFSFPGNETMKEDETSVIHKEQDLQQDESSSLNETTKNNDTSVPILQDLESEDIDQRTSEEEELAVANETLENLNVSSVVINSSFSSSSNNNNNNNNNKNNNNNDNNNNNNKTQQSPLLINSCEYIDLTALQTICGPGFAADFRRASQDLQQTIFFDVGSGHTILGVHSEPRWQCCKRREDRTDGVGCRMGASCAANVNSI